VTSVWESMELECCKAKGNIVTLSDGDGCSWFSQTVSMEEGEWSPV